MHCLRCGMEIESPHVFCDRCLAEMEAYPVSRETPVRLWDEIVSRETKEHPMYLSIGSDFSVRDSSILGIFDLDNTSTSKRTRSFLDRAEAMGQVVPCDDLPKTFVLTAEYGLTQVHLTALSTNTLEKRLSR